MVHSLRNHLQQEVVTLWHKDTDLQGCDFLVLPGGFSYGDYLRSGAIARFSPIMTEVVAHANRGGYVLGVCNGFQILTEAQLLQGALLHNNNRQFICKNVHIKPANFNTLLTQSLDERAYKIPIAHGEGRFFTDADTLAELNDNQQVLFRYCSENGEVHDDFNPNGAMENIAGICNKQRNVFGMMPHPERATDQLLGNTDGRALFESVLAQLA